MDPRPKVEVTIFCSFDFSASVINPRMHHIMAVTKKHTEIVTIQLPKSPNERIINIRITMTISIRFNSRIKGGSVRPFSKLFCGICIIVLIFNALCYNGQHTGTLLISITRRISSPRLFFRLFSSWITFSLIAPLPTFLPS